MSCLWHFRVLTFVSCSILVLCFRTFDNDYHECARPCSDKASSKKTCVYHFFVKESFSQSFCNRCKNETSTCANITGRNRLIINGKSPGPAIEICLGDTLDVLVYNKLGSDELAFHWHGIRQNGFNHMDGVPMITQCPILPFTGFRYTLSPDSAGTYFYHAHSVSQQGDGVYGPLIVRGPHDDTALERILVLSSRPSTPLTRQPYLHPSELLVNGQERGVVVRVKHGLPHLLRLINANAYDCPVLLSAHGHSLSVLAADGNPVQSVKGTRLVLFPGERLDIILMADQAVGNYALDVRGLRDCRNLRYEAQILYEGAKMDSYPIRSTDNFHDQMLNIIDSGHDCHRASEDVICSLDLKSKELPQLEEKADETIYVSIDANDFSVITDEMTDESYNFYTSKYYPAYLSLEKDVKKIPQINGMSFKYPPSPILSQPEDALRELICSLDKRSRQCVDTPLFCECLQVVQVPSRKIVEIALINEGFGGNVSYTFHLHGYNGSVVSRGSFEEPITKKEIVSLDRDQRIHRNLRNPVRKDTFVVPNKGYIILRFYTDNIGYWLWEARSTAMHPQLFGSGMQFLMRVGLHQNLPPVPINFPTCGNNKGMDLIFETS